MCAPESTRIDENDSNAFLEEQVRRLILKSKDSKGQLDPVLKVAALPKLYDGVVRAGTPIYVARSRVPVAVFSTIAGALIARGVYETNIIVFACCLIVSLVGYDLLSGFLHIVFDDPRNLNTPILGQPCLEFQMHHNFPTDLVRRKFLDVLGDLNTIILIVFVWNLCISDVMNPVYGCVGGINFFMAYYGQYSHRQAHTPSSVNNKVVQALRSLGLMISIDIHRSHHRAPHDKDFCLVGVCNPVVNFLYQKVTRNRWFWMVGFGALALGSVAAEAMVMGNLLTSVGIV